MKFTRISHMGRYQLSDLMKVAQSTTQTARLLGRRPAPPDVRRAQDSTPIPYVGRFDVKRRFTEKQMLLRPRQVGETVDYEIVDRLYA
jgi:hypothetical protein